MNIIYRKALGGSLYVAILSSILGLGSCQKDKVDLFEQSPSDRLEGDLKAFQEKLVSSPEGWILELASKDYKNGSYVVGLKFDKDGWVEATSEALENTTANATNLLLSTQRSLYAITKTASVVLSFDNYNEAIHYYSTPDRGYVGGYGKGYEAEYEFRVEESSSADTIRLTGKKYYNSMLMYKVPKGLKTEDYLRQVIELKNSSASYKALASKHQDAFVFRPKGGSDSYLLTPDDGGRNIFHTQTKDGVSFDVPFVYTPEGIQLIQTEKTPNIYSLVGWTKRQDGLLTWNASNTTFTAQDGSDAKGRPDPDYEDYAKYLGNYTLSISGQAYNVSFVESGSKTYSITGLPFPLKAIYDKTKKRVEIRSQKIDGSPAFLAVWTVDGDGNLAWGGNLGLYLKAKAGSSPEAYEFVDNGEWSSYVAKGFILWESGKGEYKNFGVSRFSNLLLTKK